MIGTLIPILGCAPKTGTSTAGTTPILPPADEQPITPPRQDCVLRIVDTLGTHGFIIKTIKQETPTIWKGTWEMGPKGEPHKLRYFTLGIAHENEVWPTDLMEFDENENYIQNYSIIIYLNDEDRYYYYIRRPIVEYLGLI